MLEQIPLDRLMLSALNVRQTERDADVASLAEDIAARGLKQNLVVIPAHFMTGGSEKDWGKKATKGDRYEVIVTRRFQALQLLVSDGRLPPDHPVPCLIEEREAARETSLSENLHRVAMNPADEFLAFAAIVDQLERQNDPDPRAACARRFGVTRRLVEERLRLAALAPELLDALRTGLIAVDSAKAYAITADHEAQRKVFEAQCKVKFSPHDPRQVRNELRGRTLSLDDPKIAFIGIDAYRAHGGRTEAEMFMGAEGAERALDVALVDRMAQARGEPMATQLAAEMGFARGLFSLSPWSFKTPENHRRVWAHSPADLPEDQRATATALFTIGSPDDEADAGDGAEEPGLPPIPLRFTEAYRPIEAEPEEDDSAPRWQPETPEQRAAREHQHRLDVWAARLAVGSFDGTPLKGRAFWPTSIWNTINWNFGEELEDEIGEGPAEPVSALVTIWVEVTAAEIAATREAAAIKVAEIEAEMAAAREATRAHADNIEEEED